MFKDGALVAGWCQPLADIENGDEYRVALCSVLQNPREDGFNFCLTLFPLDIKLGFRFWRTEMEIAICQETQCAGLPCLILYVLSHLFHGLHLSFLLLFLMLSLQWKAGTLLWEGTHGSFTQNRCFILLPADLLLQCRLAGLYGTNASCSCVQCSSPQQHCTKGGVGSKWAVPSNHQWWRDSSTHGCPMLSEPIASWVMHLQTCHTQLHTSSYVDYFRRNFDLGAKVSLVVDRANAYYTWFSEFNPHVRHTVSFF